MSQLNTLKNYNLLPRRQKAGEWIQRETVSQEHQHQQIRIKELLQACDKVIIWTIRKLVSGLRTNRKESEDNSASKRYMDRV